MRSRSDVSRPRSKAAARRPRSCCPPTDRETPMTHRAASASSFAWLDLRGLDLALLGGFSVRLGAVDGARRVLGRRVRREELHGLVVSVDHVVPDAGWHHDDHALLELLAGPVEHDLSLTLDHVQDLVDPVHLGADLL